MMTKTSFAFLFVVGLVVVANVPTITNADLTSSSHNLMVGSRVSGDYLLSQHIVSKSSKWFTVVKEDITVNAPNHQTITQVRALDQKTNGKGAQASITSGGPGNRDVTVHFKSMRGHGINFVLDVYGH